MNVFSIGSHRQQIYHSLLQAVERASAQMIRPQPGSHLYRYERLFQWSAHTQSSQAHSNVSKIYLAVHLRICEGTASEKDCSTPSGHR